MRKNINSKAIILLVALLSTFLFAFIPMPVKANGVTLKIIVTDQQKPGIDGVIDDFLASSLGTGVSSVDVIASGTRADDQLVYLVAQMTSASSEFDVIGLDPPWMAQFAENGWVVDLTSLLGANEMDDYVAGMVTACTYNGKIWAYPYFMNLGLLWYRKDILTRNGFTTADFDTWAELNATANAILNNVTEQALNPDLVGYVTQLDAYEGGVCNFFEWIGSNGVTDILAGGTLDLTNSKIEAAMTFLKALIAPRYTGVMNNSYIIPRSGLVMDEGSSVGAWTAGNAIFMRQWTFAYSSSATSTNLNATDASGNYTQFGVAPLPTFTGATGEKSSVVGGAILSIPTYSTHQTEALNLIKFLGDKVAQEYELTELSNFPALESVYDTPPTGWDWITDIKNQLPRTLARPVHPKYSLMSEQIADKFADIIGCVKTPAVGLAEMQQDVSEVIAGAPIIPGYELPILILTIAGSIATIIIYKKKKQK
jgi:ABC-type glycerol-3-phosphate transport system substrate-binding protein